MATETLRPNAAGDETAIPSQYPASTAHWDKVDEEVADDATTYVFSTGGFAYRDLYNLPASSGSGTINFIKLYVRAAHDPGGGSDAAGYFSIKSDSTVTDAGYMNLGSWATFSYQWDTNPADSEAWEWTDIDALQIGVRLMGDATHEAHCTQVYVEVDYTPGWTGKVSGVTNPAAVNGVLAANINAVLGVT